MVPAVPDDVGVRWFPGDYAEHVLVAADADENSEMPRASKYGAADPALLARRRGRDRIVGVVLRKIKAQVEHLLASL
jgi:hypothetical protein